MSTHNKNDGKKRVWVIQYGVTHGVTPHLDSNSLFTTIKYRIFHLYIQRIDSNIFININNKSYIDIFELLL